MTEEQLSALLRLKRHEKPPEGYFDRLLTEVHRRQRAELLRQPLWKIAAERWQVFFSEHSMGNVAYAGSMAMMLIVGVVTIRLMTGGAAEHSQIAVTPVAKYVPPVPFEGQSVKLEVSTARNLTARTFPVAQPEPVRVASEPRYIMDARPVSYEPSRNYDF